MSSRECRQFKCQNIAGISTTAHKSHLNQVHFAKGLEVPRPDNVKDRNDVLVVEMPEQLDLSEGPQTEHRVVKGCDALDGYAGLRWLVNGRAGEKQNREQIVGGQADSSAPHVLHPVTHSSRFLTRRCHMRLRRSHRAPGR